MFRKNISIWYKYGILYKEIKSLKLVNTNNDILITKYEIILNGMQSTNDIDIELAEHRRFRIQATKNNYLNPHISISISISITNHHHNLQ